MYKFIKFIHSADIHLDNPFSSLAAKSGLPHLRKNDLKEVFIRIADLVKKSNADFWLVCGDFVEMRHLMPSTISFTAEVFESVKPAKVIIIPGNHDPYGANSIHKIGIYGSNVFFMHKNFNKLEFDDKKTVFHFLNDSSQLEDFKDINKEAMNVLLLHGTLDMNFGKNPYNPVDSSILTHIGFDYIAMGHFHKTMMAYGQRENIFNPGSPEALGFDETGNHGVFDVLIKKELDEKVSIQYEFVNTSSKKYIQQAINVSDCKDIFQVRERISLLLESMDKKNTLYKIILSGRLDSFVKKQITHLSEEFQRDYLYLEIIDSTALSLDFEKISKGHGIKAEFTKRMLEQIDTELGPERRDTLLKALEIGLSALDNGFAELEEP